MNALALAKKNKHRVGTAPQAADLLGAYYVLTFLQRTRVPPRRCVSCYSQITNRNLGGYDGRSASTGEVYCLRCADGPGHWRHGFGGTQ